MTDTLRESVGASTATVAVGHDGASLMDWVVRCSNCGSFHESLTLVGGGHAIVRAKCQKCRRSFTARSDRMGRR